jgi:hypothetical protein
MDILIRHSAPGKLDHAPWGTQCKVITSLSGGYDLYQQSSMDEENPVWVFMDTIYKDVNPLVP